MAALLAECMARERQLETTIDQLQHALETRGVIEQAKGVLIAREGCDAEAAFDILRRASQRENRKVAVIAAEIVSRAQHPSA